MINVGQKGLILLMTSLTDSKTKHFFFIADQKTCWVFWRFVEQLFS